MKDMFFSIAMLLAGVFCAIVGMEYAPVSYTHLDVYKRQDTYSACCSH